MRPAMLQKNVPTSQDSTGPRPLRAKRPWSTAVTCACAIYRPWACARVRLTQASPERVYLLDAVEAVDTLSVITIHSCQFTGSPVRLRDTSSSFCVLVQAFWIW